MECVGAKCVYIYVCMHDGAYVGCECMLEHVHVVCTCWTISVVYYLCMMECVCEGLCVCAAYSDTVTKGNQWKTPQVVG